MTSFYSPEFYNYSVSICKMKWKHVLEYVMMYPVVEFIDNLVHRRKNRRGKLGQFPHSSQIANVRLQDVC